MASDPIPIQELDVVGYADVVATELLPRVVPPIFRRRASPDDFYLPPCRLEGARLVAAQHVTQAEIFAARARGEVTLHAPQPARRHHVLWLDEAGELRYESAPAVAEQLKRFSRDQLTRAETALVARAHAEAGRRAQAALNADGKNLSALVIKAVVALETQHAQRVERLRHVALSVDPEYDFDAHVEGFRDSLARSRFRATVPARPAQHGRPVACFAPAPALAPAA